MGKHKDLIEAIEMKREKPKDCQNEPPYPNHKTVVLNYYMDEDLVVKT